jgi:hypothetical protein
MALPAPLPGSHASEHGRPRRTLGRPDRHAADQRVIDLTDIYERLAQPWPQEQLAARYRAAEGRGAQLLESAQVEFLRPLPLIAAAIPPSSSLGVATHLLHAIPDRSGGAPADGLIGIAGQQAARALNRLHHALERDGATRGYTAEEWLPTICEITAQLLESARLDAEPPTAVRATEDAISGLSRALVELEEDSAELASTLSEVLARLLAAWIFAETARALAQRA